jgi:hypothetical protein
MVTMGGVSLYLSTVMMTGVRQPSPASTPLLRIVPTLRAAHFLDATSSQTARTVLIVSLLMIAFRPPDFL